MGMMKTVDDIAVEFFGDHKPIGEPIGESKWQMEFNTVSFAHNKFMYDIRNWSPDHKHYGKGIRLSKAEAKNLRDILNNEDLETDFPEVKNDNVKEVIF